jgi:hypothetical protein
MDTHHPQEEERSVQTDTPWARWAEEAQPTASRGGDTAKTKQNTEGGTPNPKTPPHIIKMNSELCKMAEA